MTAAPQHPDAFEQQLAHRLTNLGVRAAGVLIGVSGGADSVALLRGLTAAAPQLALTLVAAHLDHQLRGAESAADAEWVRRLCDSLRVPLVSESRDISRFAEVSGRGLEETAREVRYEFFARAAREHAATFVAVAHTADDQVETVLHRLLRGTGVEGLRGMPAARRLVEKVTLVRPLLDVSRRDVRAYLGRLSQEWREDPSNLDVSLTRNWIRHRLLPVVRERYSRVDGALLRLARQAGEMQAVIASLAARTLSEACIDATPEVVHIDCTRLVGLPAHLVREVLRLAWRRQDWPSGGLTFAHWDALARLVEGGPNADFPGGVHAARRGGLLVLTRKIAGPRVESGSGAG